jgi:arylsulfatase A-like enzyme
MKGHPQVKTPNIDRLAARGVAFMDAHCISPLCNPSRSSLLSGFHANKTGVFVNNEKFKFSKFELLPQYFAQNGYSTYGAGKIHHTQINSEMFQKSFEPEQRWSPFQQSKTVLYTKEEQASKGTDNPQHLVKNGPGGVDYILPFNRMKSDRAPQSNSGESFDWHGFDLPDNAFGDGMVSEWGINQLKVHDPSKPFFMGIGFYRPHIPLYAPKKYFDMYPLEMIELPPHQEDDLADLSPSGEKWALEAVTAGLHSSVLKQNQWKQAVQAYLACVSFVDAQIGMVLDYLETSPYANNTIIVLFSDHGWHLGEKDHWGKWTGWDRSTRVPFIIAKAGQKQGSVCTEPVSLIDLYPTLIDLAGLEEKKLDGTSLNSLMDGAVDSNRTVYSYFDRGNFAVITRQWRLIRYKDGSKELYDRQKDPNEYQNLINNKGYEEIVEMLEKQIPDFSN